MCTQCRETIYLSKRLKDLGIGTYCDPSPEDENPYHPLAWATMQTTVFDVVHMFSELGISAVPIVDARGKVINLYETVDVIVSKMRRRQISVFVYLADLCTFLILRCRPSSNSAPTPPST